ncbi:MAG: hypothetical protein LBJ93_04350 [Clostridiales bacterium]|jgi:cell fate regulator YaaT (PSP1 superfamily)|nr:hypothetical protein [Clostridiales bacterium]
MCEEELNFGIVVDVKYTSNDVRQERIIRIANEKDKDRFKKNKTLELKALNLFKDELKKREINTKVNSAKINFGCNRVVFYYESNRKISFKNIFKELNKNINIKFEAKLIYRIQDNIKEEKDSKNDIRLKKIKSTKNSPKNKLHFSKENIKNIKKKIINKCEKNCCKINSIGICGRCVCCRAIKRPKNIDIEMAKKQNLSLQKLKLAGICGKLMCCIKYEYDEDKSDK